MMVVGFRPVPIAKMRLPGDWKKTLDDPSIPARADSMKIVGLIHEPWVRESDWKLLIGRRRVAAALHNGEAEVLCKLVECTDEEGALAADIENAFREHLTPARTKELVDSLAAKIAVLRGERGKESILEPSRKKGRMKLPRTVAREIVAQATGRSKETQRKAEQREIKKNKAIEAATDHDADIGISSPWAELDDDFRRQTNKVVKTVHELAQLLSRAVGGITALVESGLPIHQARLNRLKEDVALCSSTMRGLLPTDLCPFCKGIPAVQAKCGACLNTGYITRNQREGVPKELWEVGDEAVVMFNGKRETYASFCQEPVTDLTMTTEDPFAGMGES